MWKAFYYGVGMLGSRVVYTNWQIKEMGENLLLITNFLLIIQINTQMPVKISWEKLFEKCKDKDFWNKLNTIKKKV